MPGQKGKIFDNVLLLALKIDYEAMSQGKPVPPEAGKGKKMYSPVELPEGMPYYQLVLDF